MISLSVMLQPVLLPAAFSMERFIDRPYTLTKGTALWKVSVTISRDFDIFPFYWEQGLTDDLTLVWFPVPFEVKYQLQRNRRLRIGAALNILGPLNYRNADFTWSPYLQGNLRFFLSSRLAIAMDPLFAAEVSRSGNGISSTMALPLGPLFQLTDQLSLQPRIELRLESGNPRDWYLGTLPPHEQSKSFHSRTPIGMSLNWQFLSAWEFEGDYTFLKWGYRNGYHNHQLFLNLLYFW